MLPAYGWFPAHRAPFVCKSIQDRTDQNTRQNPGWYDEEASQPARGLIVRPKKRRRGRQLPAGG